MALLDEAMAAAMTGDLGMLATGLSYCRTISACLDLFDYDRANDWIDANHRRNMNRSHANDRGRGDADNRRDIGAGHCRR